MTAEFRRLTPEARKGRKRYILFWMALLVLSILRFVLYTLQGTPQAFDSPGLDAFGSLRSYREYAASFGCTAALSLLGDAFLVCSRLDNSSSG